MINMIKTTVCYFFFLLSPMLYAACNPALKPSVPDAIYTDNNDGTVSDEKTGLMWKKCSEGLTGNDCQTGSVQHFNWKAATDNVLALNGAVGFAGYTDWRLPSVAELRSLVETACSTAAINSAVFPATASEPYWSSSPYVRGVTGSESNTDAIRAWFISFDNGIELYQDKSQSYATRLVRAGN